MRGKRAKSIRKMVAHTYNSMKLSAAGIRFKNMYKNTKRNYTRMKGMKI